MTGRERIEQAAKENGWVINGNAYSSQSGRQITVEYSYTEELAARVAEVTPGGVCLYWGSRNPGDWTTTNGVIAYLQKHKEGH